MIIDSYYKSDGYDYKDVVDVNMPVDEFSANIYGKTVPEKKSDSFLGAIATAAGKVFETGKAAIDAKAQREASSAQLQSDALKFLGGQNAADAQKSRNTIIIIVSIVVVFGIIGGIIIYKNT